MSWPQVRGHDAQVEMFRRAIERGRLGHAYLFVGPPGIGKRMFARELARQLLCESPAATGGCDKCPACALLNAGTHPDYLTAARPEEKVEFPIEAIQELIGKLSMKPARGLHKVAVVDDVDDFNDSSANCFLKTLEEPPPNSLLILIGTSPDLQLPTIRSRCQLISFKPLPEEIVRSLLGSDIPADVPLDRLIRLCDGSPGLARELADPKLWNLGNQLFEQMAKPVADGPALAGAWMEFVEAAGKESGVQRRRAGLVLRLVIDNFRRAWMLTDPDVQPRDADDRRLLPLAQRLGPEGVLRRIERCLEASTQIERYLQLSLVIDSTVDALAVVAN